MFHYVDSMDIALHPSELKLAALHGIAFAICSGNLELAPRLKENNKIAKNLYCETNALPNDIHNIYIRQSDMLTKIATFNDFKGLTWLNLAISCPF